MSLVGLTDEQYAHLHEAWRLFDTDEDGLVTPKDLQRLLRSFGYEHTLVCVRRGRAGAEALVHARAARLTCMRPASRTSLGCSSTTCRFALRGTGVSTCPSSSCGPSSSQRPSSRCVPTLHPLCAPSLPPAFRGLCRVARASTVQAHLLCCLCCPPLLDLGGVPAPGKPCRDDGLRRTCAPPPLFSAVRCDGAAETAAQQRACACASAKRRTRSALALMRAVLDGTGLENFEGLSPYQKLVRKELLNTVRTNRMTLDDQVSRAVSAVNHCRGGSRAHASTAIVGQ